MSNNVMKFTPVHILIEKYGSEMAEKSRTVLWLDSDYKLIYSEYNWVLCKRISDTKYENIIHSNVFDEVILKYMKLKG